MLLILATLLPLVSFLLLIIAGRAMGRGSAIVATAFILGSFGLSVAGLVQWAAQSDTKLTRHVEALTFCWLPLPAAPTAANLNHLDATARSAQIGAEATAKPTITTSDTATTGISVGVLTDSLTLVMFSMITLIASLVHIFSIAYLAGDPRYSRFFAYLGLFCFSMLGLVISNGLVQMFVFWELVGVCSFLLIGFWFEKREPAMASVKAMIVNRIGDAAFLVGIGILTFKLGPAALVFNDGAGGGLLEAVRTVTGVQPAEFAFFTGNGGFLGLHWLTWAGICLFGGAMAKSAQFPLHVWLPDAMAGPTPVSALIHAATMVAAGVYLTARIFPILTVDARLFVAIIGCATMILGALIAIVQTDIKKILAYSTISQLGLMMLFLGCGGYVAGLFHLFTHAFFKACLFLGSGSVIHAMHHQQDVKYMGGLWKKLPITAGTFLIAVLAISAAPFFSGYYSKELGLASIYLYAQSLRDSGKPAAMILFWLPVIFSYITAFYMARCWWLTFGGKPRDEEAYEHAHESPLMTLPLLILGVLSVVAGYEFFKVPYLIDLSLPLLSTNAVALVTKPTEHDIHEMFKYAGWGFVLGPALAVLIYFNGFARADAIRRLPIVSIIYIWLKEKMYFDHLYEGLVMRLTRGLCTIAATFDKFGVDGIVRLTGYLTRGLANLSGAIDTRLVDGAVNGVAETAWLGGRGVLAPQAGRIRVYILTSLTGLIIIASIIGAAFYLMR